MTKLRQGRGQPNGAPTPMPGMDRRELFSWAARLGLAAAGTRIFGVDGRALAATNPTRRPFVLYVHCGAWDGLAAGLLQPKDVGTWQKGLFYRNQQGESVNPNLNAHVKTHELVLNAYNSFLAEIADHVSFAVGTPQSLDHFEAESLQTSGAKLGGANPSWIVGFAQAAAQAANGRTLVVPEDDTAADLSADSDRINVMKAASIAGFRTDLLDPTMVPSGIYAADGRDYWDVVTAMHAKRQPALPASIKQQASSAVNELLTGAPELADDGVITQAVTQAITLTAVDNLINPLPDSVGIKAARVGQFFRTPTSMVQQLQLAAALIASGRANGMMIGGGQRGDLHGGGSSVSTAREASELFAHLTVFWRWVKANGWADDVMIVMSHEFTRTPYNNNPGPEVDVGVTNDSGATVTQKVRSPGTDHHLAMGMVFVNGKVPAGSRIGGIGDLFVPYGGTDLKGNIDVDAPAYTSVQLVGSMMMRCFPNLFPNERATRKVWPSFNRPIDLIVG